MGKSHRAGSSVVTAKNCITELLSAPLAPDWTIDSLAEQVLSAIALQLSTAAGDVDDVVLDGNTVTDRQARRLIRPLLASIARKSAAERATPPNLYEGRFMFERLGYEGPVWILGEFKNMPGHVRVRFRLGKFSPTDQETNTKGPTGFTHAEARADDSPPNVHR